jgi:hypothetical protein
LISKLSVAGRITEDVFKKIGDAEAHKSGLCAFRRYAR